MANHRETEKSQHQEKEAQKLILHIAGRIRTLREEQNLTQHALSKRAAMSRSSIANIEAARQTLTTKQMAAIASALGVAAIDLLR